MKAVKRFLPAQARQRIAFGFVTAMLLIAIGFVLSFYSYSRHSLDQDSSRHTDRVINSLQDVLSSLKDVETSARGFLLTQESIYLEPYQAALPRIPKRLDELQQLLADSPVQQKRLDSLRRLAQVNLHMASRVISAPPGRKNWTQAKSFLLLEKMRLDDARRWVALMVSHEKKLTESRDQQAVRSFRITVMTVFLLSVLTFVVLIISYNVLESELSHRQRVEDQLRAYEEELKAKIRQLVSSNEELERFAFVASHDLQEPLRKIQSFTSLLQHRYVESIDKESNQFMNKIMQSAERMSKMIKDLLHFSRLSSQRNAYKKVRLNEVIQRILNDQELQIKGLNAQVEVGPLPIIQAIPGQIDQLFSNLISNALKFIRPGVRPVIRIFAEPVDGSQYAELLPGRPYFRITVADNGIGFDEKYLPHIFQIFQRLHGKQTYDGTGIGLAICKRVVMAHKGYLTAASQPDQGAMFIVILPENQPFQEYDSPISNEVYSYPFS